MLRKCKTLLIVALFTTALSAGGENKGLFAQEEWDIKIVTEGNNAFALDLYEQLKEGDANLFFSPYSISTVLAMTYAGAGGDTETQMAQALHFDLSQKPLHEAFAKLIKRTNKMGEKGNFQLTIANALWYQKDYKLLEEYMNLTEDSYEARIDALDFKGATEVSRVMINTWVEKKTQYKIRDLIKLGVLNELTRLVLTNAIYFKGKWASQFKREATQYAPFTLNSGEKVDVPMMNQTQDFNYAEEDSLKILEMPYIGKDLSMVIFLPKEPADIKGLEEIFTYDNVKLWLRKLNKMEVVTTIPRFKTTSEFSLRKVLAELGMTDAFDPQSANFSGMTGKKDLWINAVLHKAFVEVNEEGTEAAAATGVVMKITAVMPKTYFTADHPFIFIIRDVRSNSILFCGRIMDPHK